MIPLLQLIIKMKSALLKNIKQSPNLQETSLLMSDLGAAQEEIVCARCQVFLNLYGGKATDSLTSLRYSKFMEMRSNGKVLEPERLPPTERAAFFHSLRVHYQVVVWTQLSDDKLDPMEWGWKLQGSALMPILTDIDPSRKCSDAYSDRHRSSSR